MLDGIKMTKIFLKDTVINSAQLGEGELVLLVHGWPEIWYSWRHQIKPIADLGFKVIAIDMRGYGESSKPIESISVFICLTCSSSDNNFSISTSTFLIRQFSAISFGWLRINLRSSIW